jgi:hypothetical protein
VYKDLGEGRGYYLFTWSNKKVKLVTGNNPLTGEYNIPGGRQTDKGYASYVGIVGEPRAVLNLARDIREVANTKDESKFKRDYI